MQTKTETKAGVVAALIHRGFSQNEGPFPPALKNIVPSPTFTRDELATADYLVWDMDFGGAWNDADQINTMLSPA